MRLRKDVARPFTSLSATDSPIFICVILALTATAFAAGPWERVIYGFGSLGGVGYGGLVADKGGNLYGTATSGSHAPCYCGLVYELTPPATSGGEWTENTLYNFQGGANDGANPMGTLIFDVAGNLYGTTQAGGSNNTGTVFELSPPTTSGGAWTETVLYIFPADQSQGAGLRAIWFSTVKAISTGLQLTGERAATKVAMEDVGLCSN